MASLPRSASALRAAVAVASLLAILQACGGRSDTQDYLFGQDGTITLGATSSVSGQGSSGGTRNGTGGTRNVTGGTRNGTGASGNTGGTDNTGFGGTSVTVGGTGVVGQAGQSQGGIGIGGIGVAGSPQGGIGVAGTGSGGVGGTLSGNPITCGNQICDSDTQSCCAGLAGLSCIGKNQMCGGAVLGCTVNSDCSGNELCCISITGDVSAASSCKARCDNMGTGRDRELCQVDADCVLPFRFCTPTVFGVNICTRRP